MQSLYLINEVSRQVNLSQKRIREYEKEGFIKPVRDQRTNNRMYSSFEISQIRLITSLIHDRGFTLACLRNLLRLAPCWNVFACRDAKKCPAYHHPHTDCWQVRETQETLCEGPCERCAIFINRDFDRQGVLLRES